MLINPYNPNTFNPTPQSQNPVPYETLTFTPGVRPAQVLRERDQALRNGGCFETSAARKTGVVGLPVRPLGSLVFMGLFSNKVENMHP